MRGVAPRGSDCGSRTRRVLVGFGATPREFHNFRYFCSCLGAGIVVGNGGERHRPHNRGVNMANVQESTVTLTGSVRRISTETGKDNKLYGTVQIENKGGISDVRLNADATARLIGGELLEPGDEITWTVRPSLWSGTS